MVNSLFYPQIFRLQFFPPSVCRGLYVIFLCDCILHSGMCMACRTHMSLGFLRNCTAHEETHIMHTAYTRRSNSSSETHLPHQLNMRSSVILCSSSIHMYMYTRIFSMLRSLLNGTCKKSLLCMRYEVIRGSWYHTNILLLALFLYLLYSPTFQCLHACLESIMHALLARWTC